MPTKKQYILDSDMPKAEMIEAVMAYFRQALCPNGEPYAGYIEHHRGYASGMVERDMTRLTGLLSSYNSSIVDCFAALSGVRIDPDKRKASFTKLRKWCGLSDTWEAREFARDERDRQLDNFSFKHGHDQRDIYRDGIENILRAGYTDLKKIDTGLILCHPTANNHYVVSGPSVPKSSFFGVCKQLAIALVNEYAATAAYEAEQDKANRMAVTARMTQGSTMPVQSFHFL